MKISSTHDEACFESKLDPASFTSQKRWITFSAEWPQSSSPYRRNSFPRSTIAHIPIGPRNWNVISIYFKLIFPYYFYFYSYRCLPLFCIFFFWSDTFQNNYYFGKECMGVEASWAALLCQYKVHCLFHSVDNLHRQIRWVSNCDLWS